MTYTDQPSIPATAGKSEKRSPVRRLLRLVLVAIVIVIALFALAVLNNNYSLHKLSRAEFSSQVDRAIDTSTAWIVQHPDIQGNPPLMFMIGDMAEMSGDPRLRAYVADYMNSKWTLQPGKPATWYHAHWVDPSVPLPTVTEYQLPSLGWQDSWFMYATAPDRVPLPADSRADLFSSTKYSWGTRLHLQLIALDIYRHFNGPSPELNAVINPVTEGVANDAYWDFRVSDSYEQRSAFILAAGRPDLVRSRWIDRVLANQQPDGAWNYCWYGWCRGVFEFRFGDSARGDQGHSVVQAAWALYQLKYKHADWIKEHYQ
jgi:hypothetical protein